MSHIIWKGILSMYDKATAGKAVSTHPSSGSTSGFQRATRFLGLVSRVTLTVLISPLLNSFGGHAALAASTAATPVAKTAASFPFQPQTLRLRFQPNFFKVGSDLFESIMHSSGIVDSTNTIRFKDAGGNSNYVHYSNLKTTLSMANNQLTAGIKIDIADGMLYSQDIKGCAVTLKGSLSFATVMNIDPGSGKISVDIPQQAYDASKLNTAQQNCGLMGYLFGTPDYIRSQLQAGLKTNLGEALNTQDFKMITDPKIDSSLSTARVFMNVPTTTQLSATTKSNFGMAVGVHGSLSGQTSSGANNEGLKVINANTNYLSGLGLEWTLDTGLKALTKNIFDPNFKATHTPSGVAWPTWGQAAYEDLGKKVDFDAGLMIRGSFLKSLFTDLYRAGFFNLQIQDSLLNKNIFALNPISWKELLDIKTPNGQPLDQSNYRDMRIEISMGSAPDVSIVNSSSIDLIVPDLTMKLSAQTNTSGLFEVLTFKARFHIVTTPQLDEDGKLILAFNDTPIEDFQVISRGAVGQSITDEEIKDRLNQTVVAILKQAKVEIPLMKNHKITIPYMGIDGDANDGSEALAVYMKLK